MATVPVLGPIESRSIGQDAENLRFQRLERVRARQRARRHRHILVVVLIFTLSSLALVALAKRPTNSGSASIRRAAPMAPPAIVAPITVPAAVAPPEASVPARVDPIPPAERAPAPRRHVAPAAPSGDSGSVRASVPSPAEPRDADGDGTAAIDWLLKTSRPGRP